MRFIYVSLHDAGDEGGGCDRLPRERFGDHVVRLCKEPQAMFARVKGGSPPTRPQWCRALPTRASRCHRARETSPSSHRAVLAQPLAVRDSDNECKELSRSSCRRWKCEDESTPARRSGRPRSAVAAAAVSAIHSPARCLASRSGLDEVRFHPADKSRYDAPLVEAAR